LIDNCVNYFLKRTAAKLDLRVTGLGKKDMARKSERGRSAITGQFVPKEYAKRNPETTIIDTVKVGPVKKRKKIRGNPP